MKKAPMKSWLNKLEENGPTCIRMSTIDRDNKNLKSDFRLVYLRCLLVEKWSI